MSGEQTRSSFRSCIAAALTAALLALAAHIQPAAAVGPRPLDAGAVDIALEPLSATAKFYVLSTGNILLVDPEYDLADANNVGSVFLYNGATGALISKLTGSFAESKIGASSVVLLKNGNFIVASKNWKVDGVTLGAVTWGNGTTGITGVVSSTNSLIDFRSYDSSAQPKITLLSNDNFVVSMPSMWTGRGIAIWADGTQGITGVVTESMGIVGSNDYDRVGGTIIALANGNYVVCSPIWDNGTKYQAGAVTVVDGSIGMTGAVSVTNSVVGGKSGDSIGSKSGMGDDAVIAVLPNGKLVLSSRLWQDDRGNQSGAVTLLSGEVGITGEVSITNSLVGTAGFDMFGQSILVLTNGNFVVLNPGWNKSAGAVTWVDASVGISGAISSTNSLVGEHMNDLKSSKAYTLSNGNYVIAAPEWDNGSLVDAGAVTWGDATAGVTGAITATNSMVGGTSGDMVGCGVTPLTNGNYVLRSTFEGRGAATWMNGSAMITGVVTESNSLVGNRNGDKVGSQIDCGKWVIPVNTIYALANGNYIVASPNWSNGTITETGAVTWVDGSVGATGTVSITNSMVGDQPNDRYGGSKSPGLFQDINIFNDGRYLVVAHDWHQNDPVERGAITWNDGVHSITGVVGAQNSLIGFGYTQYVKTLNIAGNGYVAWKWPVYGSNSPVTATGGAVIWNLLGTRMTGWFTSTNNAILGGTEGGVSFVAQDANLGAVLLNVSAYITAPSAALWLPSDRVFTGTVDTLSSYSAHSVSTTTVDFRSLYFWTTGSGDPRLTLLWRSDNALRTLRRLRSDATLTALNVSAGALTPSFLSTTLSYTATATTAGTITLTPTLSDPAGAFTLMNYAGPCAGNTCALLNSWNTITVSVLAEDWTPTEYTVSVQRLTVAATSLSSLALSAGSLTPSFVSTTYNYVASVADNVASLLVTPTTTSPDASYVVANAAGACAANTCALNVGANTITVTVTALGGATPQNYVLVVTRAATPTPTATPTKTPTPGGPTPTPAPTLTPTTARIYVSPKSGAVTTSTVSIISLSGGLTGAKKVSVNGLKMFHIVRTSKKIDFTMKPGVAGTTVDVVLVKANNTVMTITQAYTFEGPTSASGSVSAGAVLTTTSGVTMTVPPQASARPAEPAIAGSLVITYAPVEFPAEPPGDVPLSFFEVSMDVDGVGVSTLTAPATLELPVDPLAVPASQIARLYEWVAASGWSPVPGQSYDPAAGIVTAPIQRLGNYALMSAPAHQWWFPVVTLE